MSSRSKDHPQAWARRWLIAGGVYNLAWGAFVIVAPGAMFGWFDMAPMVYPEIWQCVGMIVGVYGVGYLIAARDHRRHWPIVLVGLLGKILGPIGFTVALARGVFPPEFALTIVTNDLIWWIPFAMILWDAARANGERLERPTVSLPEALGAVRDGDGQPLRRLTDEGPTLVVLLRHAGCTFCKQTLARLSEEADAVRDRGRHDVGA